MPTKKKAEAAAAPPEMKSDPAGAAQGVGQPPPMALSHSQYLVIARGRNHTFCAISVDGHELISDLMLTDVEAVAATPRDLAEKIAAWASTAPNPEYPA